MYAEVISRKEIVRMSDVKSAMWSMLLIKTNWDSKVGYIEFNTQAESKS